MPTNRTVTLTGIFAESATTTIPASPVAGVSYRNSAMTSTAIQNGWPFKTVVDSSNFNQAMYELSSIAKQFEQYGFLPWSNLTDYPAGGFALGSNGTLYQALQATGPSTTALDPTTDTNMTYWKPVQFGADTGMVSPYAGSTPPAGWLICDGSAISRTTYSALFAVIGTTYGTGDGSTTFNIPNGKTFIGSTIPCKGNGTTLGITNGTNTAGVYGYHNSSGQLAAGSTGSYGSNVGTTITADNINFSRKTIGITTDPTKSGIVADLSSGMSAVIKY